MPYDMLHVIRCTQTQHTTHTHTREPMSQQTSERTNTHKAPFNHLCAAHPIRSYAAKQTKQNEKKKKQAKKSRAEEKISMMMRMMPHNATAADAMG